jgi:hypothetical protein
MSLIEEHTSVGCVSAKQNAPPQPIIGSAIDLFPQFDRTICLIYVLRSIGNHGGYLGGALPFSCGDASRTG